jgi:hypothetical protein
MRVSPSLDLGPKPPSIPSSPLALSPSLFLRLYIDLALISDGSSDTKLDGLKLGSKGPSLDVLPFGSDKGVFSFPKVV